MTPGRLLVVTAVGHFLCGVVAYREPLAGVIRAGVVNTVGAGPLNLGGDLRPAAAASFFLLLAPLLGLTGSLLERAIAARDGHAVRTVAWVLLVVGIVSAPSAPLTPLWLAVPFAFWLFRLDSRLPERRLVSTMSICASAPRREERI